MKDRQAGIRIRREIYQQVRAELRERFGEEKGEILRYRRAYEKDLQKNWLPSDRAQLIDALQAAPLTLMGDFHALQQSQKSHLRILQSHPRPERLILALECIPKDRQALLDRFVAGLVGEADFLKKVRWKKSWGFPWEHYRPLFDWARQHRVPVLGLNTQGPQASLKRRDRVAVEILRKARRQFPDRQIIAIYGDLHLASPYLPSLWKKAAGEAPLRIFQNAEGPYFKLLEKGLEEKVDVIRWDSRTYSVQSVPPWVKWQNYLLWMEQAIDQEIEGSEAWEVTDHVARMLRWLSEELKIPVKTTELSVYLAEDPALWDRLEEGIDPRVRSWLEKMIEDGRSFYLSDQGWGFLARPSVNHSASLAMQFLHDQLSGGAALKFEMPQDFSRMVWIEGVAYFGSKIVNPKRKTETLVDMKASLSSRQAHDQGREALRLALSQKIHELSLLSGRPSRTPPLRPRRKASWIAAAHLLGGLMGERLYQGYRKGLLSPVTLKNLMSKPLSDPRFDLIYVEALEIIESLPVPFRSKKEKL